MTTPDTRARRRAQGQCRDCAAPVIPGGSLCRRHTLNSRARQRQRAGSVPWQPGKSGRPPRPVEAPS